MSNANFDIIGIEDFADSWGSCLINPSVTDVTEEPNINEESDFDIVGLDMATVEEWIYPTNYPVRDYQKNIVTKALFNNTLVSLPTGLGKTFIAAVVMYNFNRWYPHHKVVFMAHSKPLVAQQLEACCQIMGIPQHVTAQLNGNIASQVRKHHWESKSIFFLTPQVFSNDLTRGLVSAESIRCVVVDEAHKALGNQAFCQAIRSLQPFNKSFRVLALSATPGDDIPTVKSVVENLLISHLELRTEEDADIQKYLHTKKVEAVVVSLDSKIIEHKSRLLHVAEKYLRQLAQMKAISGGFGSLTSFSLVLKQKQFVSNPSVASDQRGYALSNFSIAISLYKALEELVVHGLRSFHNKLLVLKTGDGSKNNVHHRLAKDEDFLSLIEAVEKYIGEDKDVAFDPDISMARLQDELDAQETGGCRPVVYSHPKFVMLEQIITDHFEEWKNKDTSTKVIVFCKSRPCTGEICNFLNRFRPLVKPMVLIGQSNASGGSTSRGLKQSAQLEVMRKFRAGLYNTLVATCVGEEGLDVGEVDLIVNFDSSRNSNTQVQRSGRTGRKRDGRVVNLVTEGKEYQDYNLSIAKSKTMTKKLSKGVQNLPLYPNSPRLLPKNIQPVCQEMFLKPAQQSVEKTKQTAVKTPEKKKKNPKRMRKQEELSASDAAVKYDIRYAMNQVKKKPKFEDSDDEAADLLFESVGAVELFKESTKKLKPLEETTTEIIVLKNKPDEKFDMQSKALALILTKPLDAEACDFLDTLSLDELIALIAKNEEKMNCFASRRFANSDFAFNRDSDDTLCEFQEITVLTSPKEDNFSPQVPSNVRDDANISLFPINVTLDVEQKNASRNESVITITQAIKKIEMFKKHEAVEESSDPEIKGEGKQLQVQSDTVNAIKDSPKFTHRISVSSIKNSSTVEPESPSLVYTQSTRNKTDSKVKKSLSFRNIPPTTQPSNFTVFDLESDEDLFENDEKEREIILTQKRVATQETLAANEEKECEIILNQESRKPTQMAVVRPLGFNSLNSSLFDDAGWLTTDDKPAKSLLSYSGRKEKMSDKRQKSLLSFVSVQKEPKKSILKEPDISFPTFDCAPDILDDFFDSSPFPIQAQYSPINPTKPPLKQSTPIVSKLSTIDGNLSDSALDAIKAVQDFEMHVASQKPSNKADIAVFDLFDNDDDDDFFAPKISVTKTKFTPVRKKKNRKRRRKTNLFLMDEAELSGNGTSDDEDASDLDEMDSSFLDERLAPTQAPGVDMTAKYLTSTRSPCGIIGRFKIPAAVNNDFPVFSQIDVNDEDYAHDSFCVANETEELNEELSQLEVAEMLLEKKKKMKRSKNELGKKSPVLGKKRRRRIIVNNSSSDDDEKIVTDKESPILRTKKRKIGNQSPVVTATVVDSSVPPLVFIGSRHIASAPEITIALRAKYKFRVDVRSCPGADYIVSCRMGINRISLSEFCNGSPAVKSLIKETATKLCHLFPKPVIIIEDDKTKCAPRTVGCYRDTWAKHSAKRLIELNFANISTLFSRSKDETAEMISRLTKSECAKGNGVVTDWTDFSTELEARLKFYTSLPGVNVALALAMCRKFSTLSSFLSSCDSVSNITRVMGVSQSVACKIYAAVLKP